MIRKILNVALFFSFAVLMISPLYSAEKDESFRLKIEGVLNRFHNYRFSNIDVFALKNVKDLTRAIESKEKKKFAGERGATDTGGVPECVKKVDELIAKKYETGAQKKQPQSKIERDIIVANLELPEQEVRDCIYQYYASITTTAIKRIRNGYLITTRISQGVYLPSTIIGLIVSYEDEEELEKNIDRPSPSDVYTYDELKQFDLNTTEFGDANLYDLMMTQFMQNNVLRKTLEAQGIGTRIRFYPKVHGLTASIIADENDVSPLDIQSFLRISDGQPYDYNLKSHEVIISPDLLSWRRYEMQVAEYYGGFDTISTITNSSLPKFGIELRYGIDDINYPSLWSERLSLNAIWENVKLGVILPTNGWSEISNTWFNQERKLTYGGFGVTGAADFPIKVIRSSGVFHFSGGYIFGDAKEAKYKNRNLKYDTSSSPFKYFKNDPYMGYDYLIRTNAQIHYTFAVNIDADYLMRFGIGASIYNVEKWEFVNHPDILKKEIIMKKADDETILGLSGRFEFMARNIVTPYGASIQYFDEALMTNLWLQIPVIGNSVYIRLDAKGYFTAFRNEAHEWENKSVFTPMGRLILNF